MLHKSYDNPALGKTYLLDLVAVVKQEALRGVEGYRNSQSDQRKKDETQFDLGYLAGYAHAYSRVISIMMQLTIAYNIPLSELSLEDIDPDKDLMPGL